MAQFLAGIIIGGIFGFCACAIISVNNSDKDNNIPTADGKENEKKDGRA